MLELLRQIHQEQGRLDEQYEQSDPKVTFYKDFFSKYSSLHTKDIINIDSCDLVIALLASADDSLPIEELKDAVYSNRRLVEELDNKGLDEILNMIINLNDLGIFEDVMNNIRENSKKTRISQFLRPEFIFSEAVRQIAESKGSTPEDFVKFIKIISHEAETIVNKGPEEMEKTYASLPKAISFKEDLKELRGDREMHDDFLTSLEDARGKKIGTRKRNKLIASLDRGVGWNTSAMLEVLADVRKYYERLSTEETTRKRATKKAYNLYDILEKELYSGLQQQGVEIKLPDKVVSKVPNANIRTAALRLVYKHNMEIYDAKEKEYIELSANDTSHYQMLLAKYGISPSDYKVGTVMNNSLTDIEEMLQKLTKLAITNPSILLEIVQTSDLATVSNFTTLAEKGIITNDLLTNRPSLFNPTSNDYENMMRNLSLLQAKKINPRCLTANEEVFTTSHQTFKHNIETIEAYQLTNSMKTGIDTTFLTGNDLAPAIDTLLELGFEKNLEESVELLNYRDRFNRLRLLKSLNIPVQTTEELMKILTTEKFFVPDSKISDYLYNAVDYNLSPRVTLLSEPRKKNPSVSKLEEYAATLRTYNFDGVIISKNKVSRNLAQLATTARPTERLTYAVLKGSVLNDEEVSKVVTALSGSKTASRQITKTNQ